MIGDVILVILLFYIISLDPFREAFMTALSWSAAGFTLLWLLCFMDDKAVNELRLLFHAVTKAACHLYLALLSLRRAACHLAYSAKYALQPSSPGKGYPHDGHNRSPAWKLGTLHLLEAMCVLCETVPNLTSAAFSVGAALCHAVQVVVYVYAATLRAVQAMVFSQMVGEKEHWDKVRQSAKDAEKKNNSKVMAYVNGFCQDPVTAARRR